MIKRLVICFPSLPVSGQILSLPARSEPIVVSRESQGWRAQIHKQAPGL